MARFCCRLLRFMPALIMPAFLLLFCRPSAGAEPPVLLLDASTHAAYVFPAAHLLSDDTPLTHTFLLRNGTKKTLTIARIAASCECIQAEIGGRARLPVTVPPGAVVPVAVQLSPRRLLPGPYSRSVWLYWPGGPRDGLCLELRGRVRDAAAPAVRDEKPGSQQSRTLASLPLLHAASAQASVRDLGSDTWVGTDALGRALPTGPAARPARKDRYVGIFYFLTQGSRRYYDAPAGTPLDYNTYGDDPRVLRDNTQVIRQSGGDPLTKPEAWKDGGTYWWGEPAAGYFLADDPWVARKNLSMLAEAGVDTLIFDVTNGPQYVAAYSAVLDAAEQMRRQGLATPQFLFITYSSSGPVADSLYDHIYAQNKWKDLWFRWQGKPLLLGNSNGSGPSAAPPRPEVRDFFTWRYSWANTKGPNNNGKDEWEWSDSGDPQLFGWHWAPSLPEEESVLVGGWANGDVGRSFSGGDQSWGRKGQEPPLDASDLAADRDRGVFFDQQWRNALQTDPLFVFVTGWNEWTAGRQYAPGVSMLGRKTQQGQYYFVDEYNQEFSRDAMPMLGGHSDNYFMQLVAAIRRYKGVRSAPTAHGFHIVKRFDDWSAVTPEYRAPVGSAARRDWPGWGGRHYLNATGRNEIVAAKAACDAENLYFYARTTQPLSPYTGPHWMQLLIDSDQNPQTGWHGYDYAVNTRVLNAHMTTLERLSDGKTWPVAYQAEGRELMVTLPRRLLALTNTKRTAYDFHWADNVPVGDGDVADWWYTGVGAPPGRFNYRYLNTPQQEHAAAGGNAGKVK